MKPPSGANKPARRRSTNPSRRGRATSSPPSTPDPPPDPGYAARASTPPGPRERLSTDEYAIDLSDLEVDGASANATYRITDSFEVVGEYFYRDVVTNDTRLAYTRGMASLALRWLPWTN